MGEGSHGYSWAKQAAEGVKSLEDHDKWMSGRGIRQWARQRKRKYLEEGGEAVIGRVMGWRRKAITSYCRLRAGKGIGRWWAHKVGHVDNPVPMPEVWRRVFKFFSFSFSVYPVREY